MSDKEAQEDELMVLASIYDECDFAATQEGGDPGGYFYANLDLPEDFCVRLNAGSDDGEFIKNQVQYIFKWFFI